MILFAAFAPAFALDLAAGSARDEAFDRHETAEVHVDEAARHGRGGRHRHADRHRPARRHGPPHRHHHVPVHVHRHGPPPPAHVHVEEEAPVRRRAPSPDNNVSIVVNLVDVPAPLLSAGVEVALGRNLGLAGTGGIGASDTGALYDLGADLRGYLVGDFDRGLFLGGGIGTTNLTPLTIGEQATTFDGFVGGKYTFSYGLTIEGSLGLEAYTMETVGLVSPTAKVGLGWSF